MLYFELTQYLLIVVITHSLYSNIINFENIKQDIYNKRARKVYYFISIFIPLIFVVLCFYFKLIGHNFHSCWINTNSFNIPNIIVISFYYFITWTSILCNLIMIIKVIKFIKKEIYFNNSTEESTIKYYNSLLYIPISYIVVNLPAFIFTTIDFFVVIKSETLINIKTLIICLEGLFYSLAYLLNHNIRSLILSSIKFLIFCNSKYLNKNKYRSSIIIQTSINGNTSYSYNVKNSLNSNYIRSSIMSDINIECNSFSNNSMQS